MMNAKQTQRTQSNPPRRKHILLVDRHPLMRRVVTDWINRSQDLEVSAEAASTVEALRRLSHARPDLVLTELALDDGPAFNLIETVRHSRPHVPVLILSTLEERFYARRALEAGACGYLMKGLGGPAVLEGIRRALSGRPALSPALARRLRRSEHNAGRRGKARPKQARPRISR
jgi:DNA-binding NarL/FixJ family response regulator